MPDRFFRCSLAAILFASLCCCAVVVEAANVPIANEYPAVFKGTRPLGMGNAFTAMPGTDFNAQYYNPAAINDFEKKRHYSFINPQIDLNLHAFDMLSAIFDLKDDIDGTSITSERLDIFDAFTKKYAGQFHHISSDMPLFQLMHKYYSVGLITHLDMDVSLRNRSFPNFDIKSSNYAGVVAGSAYGLFDDTFQFGGNLKLLYQVSLESLVTSENVINGDLGSTLGWSAWKKGIGVGADIGAKYSLPVLRDMMHPTLSLVIQDIVNTPFTGGAPAIPMSVTVGGGIFPSAGPVDLAILFDFREVNQRIDILNKFHFGIEAKMPPVKKTVFYVRAGCNQGYPAAGFSVELPIVAFHFAFYGEEEGQYNYSAPNYRFVGQLTYGF